MRSLTALPLGLLLLGATLTGCATSRYERVQDERRAPVERAVKAPVAQADTAGPARVGLAATMTIPENPYGDSIFVGIPSPEDIASGAVPLGTSTEAVVDASDVTVSRYYYQDEGTYYYQDVADDLDDYAQGDDDQVYYGGYYADYYRYGDPAYYPSPYRYYRPYSTYRSYSHYGWYPTWRHRRAWAHGYYDPYYAGYGYYDPWGYGGYGYGGGVHVSVGWGWGGYGGYRSGYRDGYYDGYSSGGYASSGYYGPGYYGRPRHRGYDDYRDYDDGRRGTVRGLGIDRPIAGQSSTDPARQPARRGLAPARLPRTDPGGITRSTGRRSTRAAEPVDAGRTTRGDRSTRTDRDDDRTGRALPAPAPTGRTTRQAPPATREAPPRRTSREAEAPRRTREAEAPRRQRRADPAPRRESRPAPPPRRESRPAPPPRRESSPAPEPRRESRPAPPPQRESRPPPEPRRESRPAPPPQRESRPAPAPRQESSPSRSRRGGNEGGSRSRRGGNDE